MPEDSQLCSLKDLSSKHASDPLTSIKSELSRSYPSDSINHPSSFATRGTETPLNTTEARLQRESSERARAMDLIRRKKREREREALGMGNMTPSSVGEDDLDRDAGYGDVYNRKATEDAHRRRHQDRGWGRDRGRGSYRVERRVRGGTDERSNGRDYRNRRW